MATVVHDVPPAPPTGRDWHRFLAPPTETPAQPAGADDIDRLGDPELVSTEGTVDGGTFRFTATHFEWLLGVAKPLGLEFSELGKRRVGWPSTIHYCDELARLYGSEDPDIGEGASFAVENWAAAGFWKQLISGLERFR